MAKESLYDIPFGCICMGDGLMGMKCEATEHATLKNRTVVRRVHATDGWTELYLACGHVVTIATAVGEGMPAPCPECVNQMVKRKRGGRE